MDKPLDEAYFVWLYSQVGDSEIANPNHTYWGMFKQLFTKEFVWFIPNDDNRIADGKDLRYEFVEESGLEDVDRRWLQLGCSMLELLIGLSRRLAFEADGEPRDWFWQMLENMDLSPYNDHYQKRRVSEIDEILDRVIWRTYGINGEGGIFPLKYTRNNQQKIELWDQMSEYVLEAA